MITRPNTSPRLASVLRAEAHPQVADTPPPPADVRLRDIAAMGQRIHGYVEFMCQIGTLAGTSAEAKERALAAFHERLAALERQLGRIHDQLQLG